MTALRMWLLGVLAAALVISLLQSVMPQGAFAALGRLLSGLTMVLVLLQPLAGGELRALGGHLAGIGTGITAEERAEDYRRENYRAQEELIQREAGAYIAKTAEELGLTCRAEVRCREENGLPLPDAVTLDISYHPGLSRRIAKELGIPAERQSWQGG